MQEVVAPESRCEVTISECVDEGVVSHGLFMDDAGVVAHVVSWVVAQARVRSIDLLLAPQSLYILPSSQLLPGRL